MERYEKVFNESGNSEYSFDQLIFIWEKLKKSGWTEDDFYFDRAKRKPDYIELQTALEYVANRYPSLIKNTSVENIAKDLFDMKVWENY